MKKRGAGGYRGTGGDGQAEGNGDGTETRRWTVKGPAEESETVSECISITILTTLSRLCPL